MNQLDIHEILQHLPHRYPFLLVDRVVDFEPGKSIHAYKNVTINEPFFVGHFPHHPVMPGVLIMEALAQTGAVAILSLPEHRGKTAYFAGIDKAKFKQMVRPRDTLELETTIIRSKGPVGVGEAIATVNGKLAAKAELTFALK